jgi:NAD(P)-dependent dehydrogenase (short-subunit alcohol dehydrogenase family)
MTSPRFNTALIVGAGSGLSAALARALAKEGIKVALAARSTDDLKPLVKEIGAQAFACDASARADVDKLFAALDSAFAPADRYSSSIRRTSRRRSRSPPTAAFWSPSRRRGACCRRGTA